MKIRMGIALFFLFAGGIFLTNVRQCQAWQPPVQEDAGAFLAWYEENKNKDGAVYQLSGDLRLSEGSETEPIRLDGQGAVTIDTGSYGIVVVSDVVIDNPNLMIQGEFFFLLMVTNEANLTLENVALLCEGEGGMAIHVADGRILSPSNKGQVHIRVQGENVKGIQYDASGADTLSNLSVEVRGTDEAVGIATELTANLTIDNCDIRVSAKSKAYGVFGSNKTDFLIKGSIIEAVITEEIGEQYSAYTVGGECKAENSILNPGLTANAPYTIAGRPEAMPIYIEAGMKTDEWQLPKVQDTRVRNEQTSADEIMSIPVTWEKPKQELTAPGYCVVKGTYARECDQGSIINPDNIVPQITAICLPPEKMFLIAYEVLIGNVKAGIRCLTPYPYGADYMDIEYSTDGEHYAPLKRIVTSNIFEQSSITNGGLYGFHLSIPHAYTEKYSRIYLRATTYGDSIFQGTSAAWEIKMGGKESIPEDSDDGSGGDRGGQDSNASQPESEPSMPEIKSYQPTAPPSDTGRTEEGISDQSANNVWNEKTSETSEISDKQTLEKQMERFEVEAEVQDEPILPGQTDTESKEENKETASQLKKTEAAGAAYPVIIILVLAGIAAVGIWCGLKIFKTSNTQ